MIKTKTWNQGFCFEILSRFYHQFINSVSLVMDNGTGCCRLPFVLDNRAGWSPMNIYMTRKQWRRICFLRTRRVSPDGDGIMQELLFYWWVKKIVIWKWFLGVIDFLVKVDISVWRLGIEVYCPSSCPVVTVAKQLWTEVGASHPTNMDSHGANRKDCVLATMKLLDSSGELLRVLFVRAYVSVV